MGVVYEWFPLLSRIFAKYPICVYVESMPVKDVGLGQNILRVFYESRRVECLGWSGNGSDITVLQIHRVWLFVCADQKRRNVPVQKRQVQICGGHTQTTATEWFQGLSEM